MARKSDISFHLDETWDYEVEVRDADDQPITTITAAEWRIAKPGPGRVVYAELNDGITIISPGKVLVRVPRARQSSIAAGRYDHELWVTTGIIESIQVAGVIDIRNSLKRQFP